ncbi:MAG: CysZ protein [Saprospiraceae bacterium]|jgi:CysZ protein
MKKFFTDFKVGISSYSSAWKLIKEKKMWGYFFLPLSLSIALSFTMYYLREEVYNHVESILVSFINYEQWWEWAQWLTGWFIQISLFVLAWYVYLKIQKYILFIVLSPVLAYLSEKTEQQLTGKTYPFNFKQFIKDIFRGIFVAVRNFILELSLLFVLFLLGLIPVLTPFTGALALLIGWYFYGYSLMDYTNERQKLNLEQSSQSIKNKRGIAVANGMIFELIFIIPILGFVVAPILGTVAATIAMQDDMREKKDSLQKLK